MTLKFEIAQNRELSKLSPCVLATMIEQLLLRKSNNFFYEDRTTSLKNSYGSYQRKSSCSDNGANLMKDNDLYKLELDGSDLKFPQLNGERLMWTGDLESLKKFLEKRLNQQGKWT